MEPHRVFRLCMLLLFIVAVTAEEDKLFHSAYFRHENKVHVTQQSWVVSFVLEFEQYSQGIEELRTVYVQLANEYKELEAVQIHENDTDSVSAQVYEALLAQQAQECEVLKQSVREAALQVLRLDPLNKRENGRMKRSLLPFVGNILGALFGTATTSDVREIRRYLDILANSDSQIRHVLQKAVTVLNHTNMGMIENRQTVNELIEVSDGLRQQIQNMKSDVRYLLLSFKHFTLRYLQIQQQMSIVYKAINDFRAKLDSFELMVGAALQGRVTPTMIPPPMLRHILNDIRGHLKSNLELPFSPTEPLDQYYRLLKCSVVPANDGLMVITTIPLRDTVAEFDVYAIQSIPIPYQNSEIITRYQVDEKFMAISVDRTKVTFLNAMEMTICTHEALQFCPIKSPIYKIAALKKNCALALFLEKDNVQKVCSAIVTTYTTPSPSAVSLGQGQWVISTNTQLTFTKVCDSGEPSRVNVEPPMGLITLAQGCQASSEYIILPTEVNLKSSFTPDRINFSIPKLMKIWQPADKLMKESMVKIPQKLKQLASVQPSMDMLMYQLRQELPSMSDDSMGCWEYVVITAAACLVIILTAVVAYCCYMERFPKINRKPKISKPFNTRVRFYEGNVMPSHSSAARVLGNGGNQTSTGNGIPDENDDDGTCSVELHDNEMYGKVSLDTIIEEGACASAPPLELSKEGESRQKKSLLPHPYKSQSRQTVSVNCLVRE